MKITNEISVLLISMAIFVGLSFLLFKQIPVKGAHCDVDSSAYIMTGSMIYKDGNFAAQKQLPYFCLGYPLFVGVVYKLFGPNNIFVVIAQIILALCSMVLIFAIAAMLFSQWVGAVSALLFATNLGYLTFSQFILTETVLSFLLLLFVFFLMRFYLLERSFLLALSAFMLGLSVVVKPAGILFLGPLVLWIVVLCRSKRMLGWKVCGMVVVFFWLPILSYMTHNKIMFNQFRIGALAKLNMHYWYLPNVLGWVNNTNSDIERIELRKYASIHGDEGVDNFFKESLKKHPVIAIKAWLWGASKTMLGLFTTNLKVLVDEHIGGGCISFFRISGTLLDRVHEYVCKGTSLRWVHVVGYFEIVYSTLLYFFSIIGLGYLLFNRRYHLLLAFFVLYLGYFIGITGHDGCARFRMMIEAILVLLAALGIVFCCMRNKLSS